MTGLAISGFTMRTPKFTYRMPTTAAGTNAAVAKTSAGGLFGWQGKNVSGTEYYLKLYDKASAPVVGTDIPVLAILLSPQSEFPQSSVFDFQNGIAMAITRTGADADTSGIVTAGDIVGINLLYD